MTGYVRQSTAEIVSNLVILASSFNNEFNALQTAFNLTTGHTHDGTTGNAPKINLTTSVSGILPTANGGTGSGTLTTVDNTIARFDGTGGVLQASSVVISDAWAMTGLTSLTSTAVISSNVTLSGGTINSTSVGATTPSSGAFTTLAASGAFSLAGDQVQVAEGGTGVATITGLLSGNGTAALVGRTITGTAAEITVTNGSGASGNPTLSLPTALTFTGKTVTGGTFTGITDIVVADGGTGVSTFTAGFVYGSGTTALATRVMTGTANEITVTNGDGSGVPTWSLPTALTFTGKTVTGGTFSGPTISGSPTAASATWTNLGAVTTIDINGGTIDATTIGATTPVAGTFNALTVSQTNNTRLLLQPTLTASAGLVDAFRSDATGVSIAAYGTTWGAGTYFSIGAGNNAIVATDGSLAIGTSTVESVFIYSGSTLSATFTTTGINSTAIGAITASTGSFTTLTTSGAVTFTSTSTVGPTITSTDAGTGYGPILTLYRNSASPATSDALALINFDGKDSAGNQQTYATIGVFITDTTNGSEDGNLEFQNIVAGSLVTQASITATGFNGMNIGATTRGTGAFTTLGANSTVTFSNGGSMTGTWTDLGSVTTVDINGGTVDGAAVGASSASTGRFTVLTATTTVNLPSYTVAGLPAAGTAGRMAFATNCRVFNGAGTQEGVGSGTGGLVVDNGTAWKIAGTNVTAVA